MAKTTKPKYDEKLLARVSRIKALGFTWDDDKDEPQYFIDVEVDD